MIGPIASTEDDPAMNAIRRGACCALLLGWLAACGDDAPPAPEAPPAECNPAADTAQVFGPWILTYEGVRQGCEDERMNDTPYRVMPGFELGVSQRQSPGQPDELRLARAIEGMHFAGSVEGDCVRFDLELAASGISMGMSGIATDGLIQGGFRGIGPGTCAATGSFEVKFQQATLRW